MESQGRTASHAYEWGQEKELKHVLLDFVCSSTHNFKLGMFPILYQHHEQSLPMKESAFAYIKENCFIKCVAVFLKDKIL